MFAWDTRDRRIAIFNSNWLERPLTLGRERLYYKPIYRCADEELASDGWHCAGHAIFVSDSVWASKSNSRGTIARD